MEVLALKCTVYDFGFLREYKYVVIFARYRDQWVMCRHKHRDTWETAGGHIEPGETPVEAAKRELIEETGSQEFEVEPLCDYWACDEPHEAAQITWANGAVFLAHVSSMGPVVPLCGQFSAQMKATLAPASKLRMAPFEP